MAAFVRRTEKWAVATALLVSLLAQAITFARGQHAAQAPNPHGESSLAQAFQPRRDDSHVENVVKQAVADEFSSEINTNRTKAYLSCESGEMLVKINFSEPFRGVGYADYDRSSPCRFYGDGSKYYELHIPLKGCGTKQEAPRLFINNIIVRFHRSLELEEDEIKTIICRYPPPFAPLPNNVVAPILAPLPPVPALVPAKLSEIELLLIICALLFLTLLLLGIGIAYYCLKKRNIKVVKKKKAFSSAPGSEITKLSGSTLGAPALSIFEPIRIPRAQAALSTSGSEAALLTPSRSVSQQETIPSDYPSESPSSVSSDIEEMVVDSRRALVVNDVATMRQDRYRFENLAFIPDEASIRSGYPVDQERAESVSSVPIFTVPKPPTKIEMPKPRLAKEQTLTTIHEREDSLMSDKWASSHAHTTMIEHDLLPPVHIQRTKVKHKKAPPPPSVSSYAPSLYGSIPDNNSRAVSDVIEISAETTKAPPPPSVSSYAPSIYGSIPDNDICSQSEVLDIIAVVPKVHIPKVQMATLTDYYVDTQNTTDIREDVTTRRRHEEYPPPKPKEIPEEITEVTETTIVPHKPKITVKNIDDVYVTTLTEIDASEHVTRRTRDTIEEHARIPPPLPPTPPPTTFDVTIRTYPKPSPPPSSSGTLVPDEPRIPHHAERLITTTNLTSTTDVENTTIDQRYRRNWEDTFSEVSERFSDISEPIPPNLEIPQPRTPSPPPLPSSPPPPAVSPTPLPERSQTPDTEVHSGIHPIEPEPYTGTVPRLPVLEETPTLPTTWSVLVRVLKPPPNTPGLEELTPQVREKWRSVITTDSVFRSLIQECTTTEEYVRVTRSERYYHLFRPTTWQVIIRVLAAPLEPSERDPVGYSGPPGPGRNLPPRYRRKSDTSEPSRPRRNSLPPVYEGDGSNPPSVEAHPSYPYYTPGSPRSRRTSKAGSVWDYDVRSMTEEDVDFTRADRESLWSVDTGYTYKTGRSFAERSTSEFLEDVPTVNRRFSQIPPSEPRTPLSTSAPNPTYRVPMHSDPEDDDNDEPLELPIYPVTAISNRSDNVYSSDSRAYTQVSQNVQSSYSVQSSSQIRQEQQHHRHHQQQQQHRGGPRSIGPPPSSVGEREEIYSVTETDIYDWNR